ncbi:hypothetical protein D9M68_655420 [compost metagenome]
MHIARGTIRRHLGQPGAQRIGRLALGLQQVQAFAQRHGIAVASRPGQRFQPGYAAQRDVAHRRQELKRQGRQRHAQAHQHLQFETFHIDLHEIGHAVRGDQGVQRGHSHQWPGLPAHGAERWRRARAPHKIGRERGHGGCARAGQQAGFAGRAAQRLRQQRDIGIATETALQQLDKIGLRFQRDHARTELAEGRHPVPGVRADVKRQPVGRNEAAVETPELRTAPGYATVDQQRTQQAELAVEALTQAMSCLGFHGQDHAALRSARPTRLITPGPPWPTTHPASSYLAATRCSPCSPTPKWRGCSASARVRPMRPARAWPVRDLRGRGGGE